MVFAGKQEVFLMIPFILGILDLLAGAIILFSRAGTTFTVVGSAMVIKGLYSLAADVTFLFHGGE